jgi:hypothetical protein
MDNLFGPYISDQEAYDRFCPGVHPLDAIEGLEDEDDPVQAAIEDYFDNWLWDEPPPEWLECALHRYMTKTLGWA